MALLAIMNVLPLLPAVRAFTDDIPYTRARAYERQALVQGNAVALVFMVVGPVLFGFLAVTLDDLRVAGGLILLAYATHDILFSQGQRSRRQMTRVNLDLKDLDPPVAPLGVPIFIGPGTLSLLLVLAGNYGLLPVSVGLLANLGINLICLRVGDRLMAALGVGFVRAVGKVMSLVLAAVGAAMLRAGLGLDLPLG